MKETENINKEKQKRQNAVLFINAAQELIDEEGINHISIRKIADKAGFHNSTIYIYFEDLDQLIMLASIKYFQEYSYKLEQQSQRQRPPSENFYAIWDFFFDTILSKPQLFYNFFFGKRSNDLNSIMNLYYEFYPEERRHLSSEIEAMYFGQNIKERSLRLLRPLINEKNHVTEENLSMLNEMTVSYCKYKLEQKCQNPELDSRKIKEDFLSAIMYITGTSIKIFQ